MSPHAAASSYIISRRGEHHQVTRPGLSTPYLVDLGAGTCTCIGYKFHRRCKHLPMVHDFVMAAEGELQTAPIPPMDFARIHALDDVRETEIAAECTDGIPISLDEGTIIDFETTGLDSHRDEIITMGWIHGNTINVIQRKSSAWPPFRELLRERIKVLHGPFFAYNAPFDRDFARDQLGSSMEFRDIMTPWARISETRGKKWPKLAALAPGPLKFLDRVDAGGNQVPEIWHRYLVGRDPALLGEIIDHNRVDLIRSLSLMSWTSLVE